MLGLDPAEAVYVFAPTSVGLVLALGATPGLMRRFGERRTALLGFTTTATSLFLLGLVRHHRLRPPFIVHAWLRSALATVTSLI